LSGLVSDVMDKLEYSSTCTRKVRFDEAVCGDFAMVRDEGSGDQIWKNEMGGACSMYGAKRGVYRVLVGKPGRNRPHGRHRHKWEDNIKLDFQEAGCEVWTGSIRFRIETGGRHL
jgi:hypothetical protein